MFEPRIDVQDHESAVAFIKQCVDELGMGYHPDTLFEDYVAEDGRPMFDLKDAQELNALISRAFEFCDPYDVGMQEFERRFGAGVER